DERQHAVEPERDPDVRVFEKAVDGRPRAVHGKWDETRAEGEGEYGHEGVADDALARMLADGGRDVHYGIAVMHDVVAPESGDLVHRDVRDVEREVEDQEREHQRGERRQRESV